MICCGCAPTGVNVTVHAAWPAPVNDSVHVCAGAKLPPAAALRLMLPLGVIVAPAVSLTVVVQLVALPAATEAGEQTSAAVTACLLDPTAPSPLLALSDAVCAKLATTIAVPAWSAVNSTAHVESALPAATSVQAAGTNVPVAP